MLVEGLSLKGTTMDTIGVAPQCSRRRCRRPLDRGESRRHGEGLAGASLGDFGFRVWKMLWSLNYTLYIITTYTIHTIIYIYIYINTHLFVNLCIIYIYICIHANTHTHTYTHTHTLSQSHSLTSLTARTHACMHARTHTHTHRHTHTHTHTHSQRL